MPDETTVEEPKPWEQYAARKPWELDWGGPPKFDPTIAAQPTATEEDKAVAFSKWYEPPPEFTKSVLDEPAAVPDLGPQPSDVPTRDLSQPMPADESKPSRAMMPVESAGNLVSGVVDWATSPKGAIEQAIALTPAAPAVLLKWATDMIKSGKESLESIGGRMTEMLRAAISDKYISANQLGAPRDLTPEKLDEHIQGFSDDIVNLLGAGLGAAGALHGAVKTGATLLPKTAQAATLSAMGDLQRMALQIGKPEFTAEDRGPALEDMARKYEASRATAAGSPFMRTEPAAETISMGPEQARVVTLGAPPTFDPSGIKLAEPVAPKLEVEPPPAPDRTVEAANAVRELAAQRARTLDFAKAVAERVSEEQEPPIHPDKPLTDNQLRIIHESLTKAVADGQIPGPSKGLIVGSALEKWADDVLRGGGTHAGPDVIAAYLVRGVAFLEKGITDFARWSAEMVKEFGEKIRPQLQQLHKQSMEMRASQFLKPKPGDSTPPEAGSPSPKEKVGYGISQQAREQRAAAGQVERVEPGVGTTGKKSVELGRSLLKAGADPVAALERVEKSTKSLEQDAAVTRAYGEKLAVQAEAVKDQLGENSPEYKKAFEALSAWDKRTKPTATLSHKMMVGHQGMTDLDTGSYTGLRREHAANTQKDFTPKQSKMARRKAKSVKDARTEQQQAQESLTRAVKEQPVKPGRSSKPGVPDLTTQLWKKARDYVVTGHENLSDIIWKIGADTGLSHKQVLDALGKDKRKKYLADEVWRKQQKVRLLDASAKRWLRQQQMSLPRKALEKGASAMFIAKIGGGVHGLVALGTHAPMLAFRPNKWPVMARNYRLMAGLFKDPAFYEASIQDLMRRKNYRVFNQAGLGNNPYVYEDFSTKEGGASKWQRIMGAGNRGYSVLKFLRQDLADQWWDKLPATAKTPEMAAMISLAVNHETGWSQKAGFKGAHLALFAPRLLMAKTGYVFGDTAKTIGIAAKRVASTVSNWEKASPQEQAFASHVFKEKATVVATMLGLLAANQAILSMLGSNQKINGVPEDLGGAGIDPMKSDFLKFKAAGKTISYGNSFIAFARLPLRMAAAVRNKGKLNKIVYEDENLYKVAGDFARTQLSPIAGTTADLLIGRDFQGRPLPRKGFGLEEGDRTMPKRLRAQGVQPYTWTEYLTVTALPIPLSQAMHDVWHEGYGLDAKDVDWAQKIWAFVQTIPETTAMAVTGARIGEDWDVKK